MSALRSTETPTTVSFSQEGIADENYSPETGNLPVGIRDGQKAKLAGTVNDEIFSHLAKVDHQQGGNREEFHCKEGRKSGGERGACLLDNPGSSDWRFGVISL